MNQVVIEKPVLNSSFEEPKRYFKFTEDGVTDEIIEERRISQCFVLIHQKKRSENEEAFIVRHAIPFEKSANREARSLSRPPITMGMRY